MTPLGHLEFKNTTYYRKANPFSRTPGPHPVTSDFRLDVSGFRMFSFVRWMEPRTLGLIATTSVNSNRSSLTSLRTIHAQKHDSNSSSSNYLARGLVHLPKILLRRTTPFSLSYCIILYQQQRNDRDHEQPDVCPVHASK